MIVLDDLVQGSPEWHQLRRGLVTASNFSRVVTAGGGASKQAPEFATKIVAQRLLGADVEDEGYSGRWTRHGMAHEDEARDAYAFILGVEVVQVGLIVRDEPPFVGASPDGLVEDDGGVEIKCPAPWTLLNWHRNGTMPNEYIPQVQGNLFVTGRRWWDFFGYHPQLHPLCVRVPRDEEYIAKLRSGLATFLEYIENEFQQLGGLSNEL